MRNLFGGTDTGRVRSVNQDRFQTAQMGENLAYAVLCDGMGGENGGHIASEIATRHMVEALGRDLAPDMGETTIRGVLLSAVSGANALVYETAQVDESLAGMGTTLIAAVFSHNMLYVAYVGDSRVYCVNPQQELQLTKDHTMVQMLVDIGEISEDDARNHPKRHFITRAVGVAATVEVDFLAQELLAEDIVLICSDGLYNYLTPGSFYGLLSGCLEQESVQSLIDLANAAGGSDNITAIVVR